VCGDDGVGVEGEEGEGEGEVGKWLVGRSPLLGSAQLDNYLKYYIYQNG